MKDLVSLLNSPYTLDQGFKWSYCVHDYESVAKRTKMNRIDEVQSSCTKAIARYRSEVASALSTFHATNGLNQINERKITELETGYGIAARKWTDGNSSIKKLQRQFINAVVHDIPMPISFWCNKQVQEWFIRIYDEAA